MTTFLQGTHPAVRTQPLISPVCQEAFLCISCCLEMPPHSLLVLPLSTHHCMVKGVRSKFRFSYLLGELLLTQLVKREEFARQLHVVYKPTTGQFYPDNDLTVWNHHGHRAEVDLQVFRELLTACVTWILITPRVEK